FPLGIHKKRKSQPVKVSSYCTIFVSILLGWPRYTAFLLSHLWLRFTAFEALACGRDTPLLKFSFV
ncbi:MAG: hypothetical protein J6J59_01775, partial [Peptococcaceae bacterium]|nr:hypothetical protein [Peptococcaceae bacterium]